MATRDIVVVGASAGGLPALMAILRALAPPLRGSILVVMHTHADSNGVLPSVLAGRTALRVSFARDGQRIARGHVYIAKPDFHLLVTNRQLRVMHGPRENGFRPAIDPLFRTAARAFGPRVIGVILSGALDDGTYGLSVIKHAGGVAIVQDPAEAIIPNMPRSAIAHVDVDYVLPASAIGGVISRLITEPAKGDGDMARSKEPEPQLPARGTEIASMEATYGTASALTCPDCGGALWEIEDGRVVRYQCHTGHQFAPDSLQFEQREAVDNALWSAVRVLEEHGELKMRMARRAAASGLTSVAEGFEEGARDAHRQAHEIRAVLFEPDGPGAAQTIARPKAKTSAGARRAPRARRAAGQRRAARKSRP